MGLSGIKGRLQSIGGEIHIVSEAKRTSNKHYNSEVVNNDSSINCR